MNKYIGNTMQLYGVQPLRLEGGKGDGMRMLYVKNGKVDFDFSGKKKIDGKTYKIKNGKVA